MDRLDILHDRMEVIVRSMNAERKWNLWIKWFDWAGKQVAELIEIKNIDQL